jgi:glycosyltransferase involved in cell wall biosynthesis
MEIGMIPPLYESCPPKLYGGTERVVDNLCKGLTRLGHHVTLFASEDSNTEAQLIPIVPRALRLANVAQDLPYMTLQIAKVIEMAGEFDIIHNHIDFLPYPYIGSSPCPWITTLHGRLDYPDLQLLYKHFQQLPLVSISDAQRKPLYYCNWLATVYHGIDVDMFTPNFSKGKYLAFLGRICADKGTHIAIAIAKQLQIPLKIAAKVSNDDREFFETVIKPQIDGKLIEFIGEINEYEKSEFLSNALCLLTPIDWPEPFGLVVIESYACGTPVVGRPCGSLPEIIVEGKTGFLRNTLNELVAAVNDIAILDRRYIREFAEQNFSYTTMAQNYLKLYDGLNYALALARRDLEANGRSPYFPNAS